MLSDWASLRVRWRKILVQKCLGVSWCCQLCVGGHVFTECFSAWLPAFFSKIKSARNMTLCHDLLQAHKSCSVPHLYKFFWSPWQKVEFVPHYYNIKLWGVGGKQLCLYHLGMCHHFVYTITDNNNVSHVWGLLSAETPLSLCLCLKCFFPVKWTTTTKKNRTPQPEDSAFPGMQFLACINTFFK